MTDRNKVVTGLIVGALIGTVAGMLFAPKPGKETRHVVAGKAGEWRVKAGDYVGTLRQRIRRGAETNGAEELTHEHLLSTN